VITPQRRALLLMSFVLALGACDPESTGQRANIGGEAPAAAAAKPAGPAAVAGAADPAKAGEEKAPEAPGEYAYNPIGKRDPFRSFFRAVEDTEIPNPTPLQRFDIEQYKLVGVVWGIDSPRAMVQDPEQTGHILELGTYVGKHWGRVTQISRTSVVVTEEYKEADGNLVTEQTVIALPVEEGGTL
jgi:type IV pilus assembly protein PilP